MYFPHTYCSDYLPSKQECSGHGPSGHGPSGHGPSGHGPSGHGPSGELGLSECQSCT